MSCKKYHLNRSSQGLPLKYYHYKNKTHKSEIGLLHFTVVEKKNPLVNIFLLTEYSTHNEFFLE